MRINGTLQLFKRVGLNWYSADCIYWVISTQGPAPTAAIGVPIGYQTIDSAGLEFSKHVVDALLCRFLHCISNFINLRIYHKKLKFQQDKIVSTSLKNPLVSRTTVPR